MKTHPSGAEIPDSIHIWGSVSLTHSATQAGDLEKAPIPISAVKISLAHTPNRER